MRKLKKETHEFLWGLTALAMVVLVGLSDHFTGKKVSLQTFYLLAILLAGMKAGGIWGLLIAAASAGAYFVTRVAFLDEKMTLPIHLWNTAMRLSVFMTIAILLRLWKRLLDLLEKQVSERTSQLVAETAKCQESEQRVKHLNEVLRSIRNVNQLIIREKNPEKLFQQACEILVQTRGYRLVWVGVPETKNKWVVAKAYAGTGADSLVKGTITWDESTTGQGLNEIAIRIRKTQISQDISTDPRFAPFREAVLACGFASAATTPIFHGDKLFGVLNIYADHPEAFDKEEVELLEELAGDLALGLENIESDRKRKQAEDERKNLLEQLVRSEKLAAVGELISGVAHEINNPLAGIVGLSELLLKEKKENLDEDTKKDLEFIYQSSERIRKIVTNLLRFARREAPARKNVNINEHLDTVLTIRSYEMKIRNVEVIKRYQPDLPLVMADPSQLEQVFLNLITNAEYAIHETHKTGTLTIATSLQEEHPEDKKVIIEISDTGAGIPENVFSRLFNPFFTTKPVGKGTGLGLSVSYGIIKEHGGAIHVRNRAEGGAVFTIELPVSGGGRK